MLQLLGVAFRQPFDRNLEPNKAPGVSLHHFLVGHCDLDRPSSNRVTKELDAGRLRIPSCGVAAQYGFHEPYPRFELSQVRLISVDLEAQLQT